LGVDYYIEATENLEDLEDFPFKPVPLSGVSGNGERILWVDQNADAVKRFYRVVVGSFPELVF
jgi:hypothetical protein